MSDQRTFFDELISREWDAYQSVAWDETRNYEVAQLFSRIQPKKILDVGCGCGFHDQVMSNYHFVKQVTGIDYSSKSIDAANKYYSHEKVKRVTCDFQDVTDSNFDLVVSWQVFEHLSKPGIFFSCALKALSTHGWLVIFTPNRLRLRNRLRLLKGEKVEYCDPQHFYEYIPAELKEMGRIYGLEYVDWFGYQSSGLKIVDQLSNKKRLKLGYHFPIFADLFCIIFRKT